MSKRKIRSSASLRDFEMGGGEGRKRKGPVVASF